MNAGTPECPELIKSDVVLARRNNVYRKLQKKMAGPIKTKLVLDFKEITQLHTDLKT